jgi:hypothetical protein
VRRGRIRGLGVTLISQRPAVVNKDVLSQVESLIVLGLTGTHDIAAIDDWIRLHAEDADAKRVKASLPSLPVGTAWIWSPEWLGLLKQVHIRMRHTFDSSATPKAGVARVVPSEWAKVDVAALVDQLATVQETPKDSTPALRMRVRELEQRLAAVKAERVEVPVPVLTAEQLAVLLAAVETADDAAEALAKAVAPIAAALAAIQRPAPVPAPREAAPRSPVKSQPAPVDGAKLSKAERAILSVLAQHGQRSVVQVALLTGYSHKSGGYRNALSSLRSQGFIEGRGDVEATLAGLDALGEFDPLPNGARLLEWWYDRLGLAERKILATVVTAWPREVPVDEIAERTGYSASSGGFRNALSRLRSLELASGRGELRASDVLGEAASS